MTAFNLNDAVLGDTYNFSAQSNGDHGARWSVDGTKLFIGAGANTTIYQYTASTPFSVASLSYSGTSKLLNENARSFSFGLGGTRLFGFTSVFSDETIFQWNLSTAWDISTAGNYVNTLDPEAATEGDMTGMWMRSDGSQLFIDGVTGDRVWRYEMSTAGDLSTAAYSGNSTSIITDTGTVADLTLSSNGLYVIYGQGAGDHTWMRKLNTAWDLSGGQAPSGSTNRDLTGLVGGTYTLADINPTGSKLYVIRNSTLYELVMAADAVSGWTVGSVGWQPSA